jgi:hypothetical protein
MAIKELETFYVLKELGGAPEGINQKHMESDRGFLNYVTQACPALVPYLRESISLSMAGDLIAMTKVGSADARK